MNRRFTRVDCDRLHNAGLIEGRSELIDAGSSISSVGRQLIVHREPIDGAYSSILAYADDETIAPQARPDGVIRVADLLPANTASE